MVKIMTCCRTSRACGLHVGVILMLEQLVQDHGVGIVGVRHALLGEGQHRGGILVEPGLQPGLQHT